MSMSTQLRTLKVDKATAVHPPPRLALTYDNSRHHCERGTGVLDPDRCRFGSTRMEPADSTLPVRLGIGGLPGRGSARFWARPKRSGSFCPVCTPPLRPDLLRSAPHRASWGYQPHASRL